MTPTTDIAPTEIVEAIDLDAVETTEPGGKKKRRAKKGNRNKDKYYFNNITQAAIVEYQTCEDQKRREHLYRTDIAPAYEKLVENLINIHKFSSLHDSYDDLKNDCINFLFETIYKFDSTRGTNAFSYFNVVAKNWLIIKTKQKNLKTRANISLDDVEAMSANELRVVEEHQMLPAQDDVVDHAIVNGNILEMLYEIKKDIRTENELTCINSIITIFENVDNIDLLNKNAIMLYMRELSRLSPKQLTTALQSIKKIYRKVKKHEE